MPSNTLSDRYDLIDGISSGTCGDVLKARNRTTGEIVAVKQIKILNQDVGFPPNSLQEISILRKLNHPNIAKLIEVCTEKHHVYLVFKYYQYDMFGLLYCNPWKFTVNHVRCFSRQLLLGVKACHDNNILHRDLKPANLLVNTENNLQITDFGLANQNPKCNTAGVITIWYRPPEILLGMKGYGKEVDIWSAGCIIYEMITREVLFRSDVDTENQQLQAIFSIAGLPTQQWPEWVNLPNSQMYINNRRFLTQNLRNHLYKRLSKDYEPAIPLIESMLHFNPAQRATVDQCLQNPFLASPNGELEPKKLPPITILDSHQSIIVPKLPDHLPQTQPKRPPPVKLI